MNRYSFTVVALAMIFPLNLLAGDLLTPVAAERLGMVESWHRQLGTPGGAGSIVDIQLWVQRNTEREFVEVVRADKDGKPVEGGEVLRRICVETINSSGVAIGAVEAERLAKIDVLKLERRGVAATHRPLKIRQVRLYVLGDDGGLSATDAETGESLWSLRIGDPNLGYGLLGIADGYVTVINGTTMYRVIADARKAGTDSSTLPGGRPIAAVRLDRIPTMGATNTNSYVVIPNTRNGIDCYSYEEEPGQPDFQRFNGQVISKPVRYPTSSKVAWTTERGFTYVMETDGRPSTLFRLQTDGKVAGGVAAASNDRFFFGSAGGRVYGIRATRTGEVIWNRSFGEPFYVAPFVSGEHVLIASSYGNLFSLKASDGTQEWAAPAPNVETIFASAGAYYFGRTTSGLLTILNRESGQAVSVGDSVFVDRMVTNPETDRIYLLSDGATIQCLRPTTSELPVFASDAATPAEMEPKEEVKKPKPGGSDPFGAEDAGGEMAPADGDAPGADPFGGAADPFGSGDAAGGEPAMEDPFGAAG